MYQIDLYLETSIKGVRSTAGWYGYVLEWIDTGGNARTLTDFKCESGVTPNQLILTAFRDALQRIRKPSEITIYTDALYLRGNYVDYLPVWRKNGWKTAHGEPVKNRELWEEIIQAAEPHRIAFGKQYRHAYKSWMVSELTRRRTGR